MNKWSVAIDAYSKGLPVGAGGSFIFPMSGFTCRAVLLCWITVGEELGRCCLDSIGKGFFDFQRPAQTLADQRNRRTQNFELAGDRGNGLAT